MTFVDAEFDKYAIIPIRDIASGKVVTNLNYFFYILLYNIVPLSVLIAMGILLQKVFKLDLHTFSKLNFYLFSPVIIFKMLYESNLTVALLFEVLLFFFIFLIALGLLAEICIRIRGLDGGMKIAMRNSVIFYNSANYAIPLNQLVFMNNPFTLSVQMIIMMMQGLLPNTLGIYMINAHRMPLKDTLRTIATMPIIYTIPLAFLLKGFKVPIPEPIYIPIDHIANGFIVMALLTLGAQLGSMKWSFSFGDVLISNTLRLLVAPLLGWLIVWLMGIKGEMAQALVLSCAVPTSLSSVLLAVEFDSEPEFASQAVFSSTVLSMITVTLVIYLVKSPLFA